MSGEGKYGRLPKPKDRTDKANVTMGRLDIRPTPAVDVKMGDVSLASDYSPEQKQEAATAAAGRRHDVLKRAEFDEEEGDTYHHHSKPAPEESMVAKIGRMAGSLGAAASAPWSKMMGDKKDEEE